MSFNIQCNKCWAYQEPLLEVVKDDKKNVLYDKSPVICSNCGEEITSVTTFTKRSMYSLGQVKRDHGTKKAFSIQCPSCNKKDQPILHNGNVICKHCNHSYDNLPKPYLQTLKDFLSKS